MNCCLHKYLIFLFLLLEVLAAKSQIQNNNIYDDQVVCDSSFSWPLYGTIPTGGNGTYTYLWIYSSDSIIWTEAPGQNDSVNYNLWSPLYGPDTLYFIRIVYSGSYIDSSNVLTVIVLNIVTISNNNIFSDQDVCWDETPLQLTGTSPFGGFGPYYYQWICSDDTSFNSPEIPAGISNQSNYNFPGPLNHDKYFIRIVSIDLNISICPSVSNSVLIKVSSVTNNIIQDNQEVCYGGYAAVLSGPAPDSSVVSSYDVIWEESPDSINFSPASGTNDALDYFPGQLFQNMYYRRRISVQFIDTNCPDQDILSNVVYVKIKPDIYDNIITPVDTNIICYGNITTIISETQIQGGNGIFDYLWQISSDGIIWNHAPGINNNEEYTTTPVTFPVFYKRIVYSAGCSDTSNVVSFLLDSTSVTNNFISINSMDSIYICGGSVVGIIDGTLPTGGTGSYEYFWEKTTNGINWQLVNPPPYDQQSLYYGLLDTTSYFKRTVHSGNCFSESNIVKVEVGGATNNYISDNQSYCSPNIADSLHGPAPPLISQASTTYLWEQSNDSITWGIASGTYWEKDYFPDLLNTTTYFRRTVSVSSGACTPNISNVIKISIAEPLANNNIYTLYNDICSDTSVLIEPTPSIPTGGDGNYSYLWQDSIAGGIWQDAQGTNNLSYYQSVTLNQQTYFRRLVSSCGLTVSSNIVEINVFPSPDFNFDINDSICVSDGAEFHIDYTGYLPYYVVFNDGFITDTLGPVDQVNYVDYFTPVQTTDLTVYEVFDTNGCSSNNPAQIYHIVVFPEVDAFAGNDTVLCGLASTDGLKAVLNDIANYGYWFNPSGTINISDYTNPETNISAADYGTYYLEWHEENERCSDMDDLFVTFLQIPEDSINYAGENQYLSWNYQTVLNAQTIPQYIGTWGVILGSGLFNDVNSPNTLVHDLQESDNILIWTLHNDYCPDKTDTITITVNSKIIIPSGFSPNGDGTNDMFVVEGLIPEFNAKLSIFDRWGNQVAVFEHYANDWNGTDYKGTTLPDDTYFYILNINDSQIIYKGFVVIKR